MNNNLTKTGSLKHLDISKMSYSDFSLMLDEKYDEFTCVLEEQGWEVYQRGEQYFFYECEMEADSDTFYELELYKTELIDNDKEYDDLYFIDKYKNVDCTGELINVDVSTYAWFKAKKTKI